MSDHSTISNTQIWDATGVRFDCENGRPVTGKWRPLTAQELNPRAGHFNFSISNFGVGTTLIPTGIKAWSIGVISGAILVNGVGPMPLGTSLNGGNYESNATLSAPITITAGSGALGILMWEM